MTARDGARRPDPQLIAWLRAFTSTPTRKRCLVVGCGSGDDAEALASAGFEVTAFDASPEAIASARRRFPRSGVDYVVADVLDPPAAWTAAFDLVFDRGTVDVLPAPARAAAVERIAAFPATGGRLFVLGTVRDVLAGYEAAGLRPALIEPADAGPFRAFFDRLEG